MTNRWKWRGICTALITSMCVMWAPDSLAAEKLVWLMRDLPPLSVHEGPKKGQGVIDQLMPMLIASLPHYEHIMLRVNRARASQMLESPTLTCDPLLLWNARRANRIAYSNPIIGLHSNGLVIRRQDQPRIEAFIHEGSVDLPALLNAQTLKLGIVAKRSYGEWIDEQLMQGTESQIVTHYGNDASGNLLQMLKAGRLQTMLGYWPEIQSKTNQLGLLPEDLVFYPIKGAPTYQPIYIGCSNTHEGREIIRGINTVLTNINLETLMNVEAQTFNTEHLRNEHTEVQPSLEGSGLN